MKSPINQQQEPTAEKNVLINMVVYGVVSDDPYIILSSQSHSWWSLHEQTSRKVKVLWSWEFRTDQWHREPTWNMTAPSDMESMTKEVKVPCDLCDKLLSFTNLRRHKKKFITQMERSGLVKCVDKFLKLKPGWHSTRNRNTRNQKNPKYFAAQTVNTEQSAEDTS